MQHKQTNFNVRIESTEFSSNSADYTFTDKLAVVRFLLGIIDRDYSQIIIERGGDIDGE